MIGIYKITNQITGEVYIGQSIRIKQRWREHCINSVNGTTQLYQAMRNYGLKNFSFDVIEECDKEKLNEREIYWISYYDSFNKGYNMTPGGSEPSKVNPQEIYDLWGNYIATYSSQAEAERQTGINRETIGWVIRGKRQQAGGYQWLAEGQTPQDLTKR